MAGKPVRVTWRETPEQLHQAYRRERKGEVMVRLHALWLLALGQTMKEVAAQVGVGYRAVCEWVHWYRQGGLETVRAHLRGNRQGRVCALSEAQQEELRAQLKAGRFASTREARDWVQEHYQVHYTEKGMWRLLRRLKGRWNVMRPVGMKACVEEQEAWKKGGCRQP